MSSRELRVAVESAREAGECVVQRAVRMMKGQAEVRELWSEGSPFARTLGFSDWLFAEAQRVHSISLANRARYLARYLIEVRGVSREQVEQLLNTDFEAAGREAPTLEHNKRRRRGKHSDAPPKRQRQHLAQE